jgi:hypothetical protein
MVLSAVRRLIRSPAIHFALLGFIAFAGMGDVGVGPRADAERSSISLRRVQLVHEQIAREKGRQLTDEEKSAAIGLMLDREALFLYSREIGLHSDPVVQRRLSLIAEFVAENPGEGAAPEARAREAIELGLIEGDSVTRRIMIDGARRLIRATALIFEPDEEALQRRLDKNPRDYQVPGRTRITHIALNRNRHGSGTRTAAQTLLERLVAENIPPEQAAEMGDPTVVDPHLPAITDRGIERRFGAEFVEALADFPVGSWRGPVASPLGHHLVYVHERIPQRRASLEEVHDQVSSDVRNEVADQVLKARLVELRQKYNLRSEEPRT